MRLARIILFAALAVSSAQADDTLVPFESSWKYLHDGSDQGIARNVLRDDGAVVYLNGAEIFRSNMPGTDPIEFRTAAISTVGGADEDTYFSSGVLSESLAPGKNVLAVEVHQKSLGGSDVSFDLGLVGLNDLTRGPYLQKQSPTSIVIRWSSSSATDSRVRWGPSVGNLTNMLDDATVETEHEVELSGLTPGSTVFYSVGSTNQELAGNDADHFFVMPPVHGSEQSIRIWALGDSGTANNNAAKVRDEYASFTGTAHTELWLMLGDNAYDDGTDAEYQDAVFDMYPELLRKSVLWPTLGNHDGHTADSVTESGPYYDIFTLPDQAATDGVSTGVDSGTEAYYSFDFANIHFIVLESYDTDATFRDNMKTWLTADIAATTAVWVIAYWHHPPYTMGSHNSDIESRHIYMRGQILPILEAGGVDLVLGGHSHSYERSYLLDGHYGDSDSFVLGTHALDSGDGSPTGDGEYRKNVSGQAPHLGAVQVVAGSSGKTSHIDPDAPHEAMRNMSPLRVLGSVVLDVTANIMDVTFLTGAGTVDDSFRIEKEYDGDGVPDGVDNCPHDANAGQEDLDGDGIGNVCDGDVDGDGLGNDIDGDDDNDGLSDEDEATAGSDPFDPDSDNDRIRDGLDFNPTASDNFCSDDTATVNQAILEAVQCAAPVMVIVDTNTKIMVAGHLRVISPVTEFNNGFVVHSGGELSVFTENLPGP